MVRRRSPQTMHGWIFLFTGLMMWMPAPASGQVTFEEAIQEGKSFGSAGPQGKDPANALINQAQNQGVPGLTPEAQSNAETQGSFCSYLCVDANQQIDGCASYRNQPSCVFQGSACLLSNEYGQCFSLQESYACTTQTLQERCAQEGVEVICPGTLEGIRCLDPNECADTTSIPNADMPLAASQMGALAAVEDDHTADPVIIFTGNGEYCRKTIAGGLTRNCCALDTTLLGCNSADETLQAHRNAGQCVEVGTYCSREENLVFTRICVERSTSFCCFSSKLTRIIQEQGRAQLGIGWGTPQAPDCRGLTVDELQRINFERIDFSEYYADITANPPDPNQLTTQTQSSGALIPNPENVPPPPGGISPDQVQQDLEQFFGTRAP